MRAAAFVLAAVLLAGCTTPAAVEPATLAADGEDEAAPPGGPVDEAADPTPTGPFAPFEAHLSVTYFATVMTPQGRRDTGNMDEAEVDVAMPAGATEVRITATWEPSTPLTASQTLMIHNGTRAETSEMIGEGATGGSPLVLEWTRIPDGLASVVVMVHVDGQAAAQLTQDTHVLVEFR